jgi:GMP synthase (glutamine-hydrolysing)
LHEHAVTTNLRFLLLQVRNRHDPMLQQEVACFARALDCRPDQIEVFDLIGQAPTVAQLSPFDCVLLGGSGDYSVAEGGSWLEAALFAMRELYELNKPTFASCWGFQAMARALGGTVVTDPRRAELGTVTVRTTAAGQADPLFADLGREFLAQMGHQDIVEQLPPGALLLASTERVENQAFCFPGKPIYCTQFHPELDREGLITRVRAYPQYVENICGMPLAQFEQQHCRETPEANALLRRFMAHVLRGSRSGDY